MFIQCGVIAQLDFPCKPLILLGEYLQTLLEIAIFGLILEYLLLELPPERQALLLHLYVEMFGELLPLDLALLQFLLELEYLVEELPPFALPHGLLFLVPFNGHLQLEDHFVGSHRLILQSCFSLPQFPQLVFFGSHCTRQVGDFLL